VSDHPFREPVFSLITGHFRREVLDAAGLEMCHWEVVIVDSVGRVRSCEAAGAGMEQEIQNWPVRLRLSPHILNEINVVCEVLAGLEERLRMGGDEATQGEAVEIAFRNGRSFRFDSTLPVFNLFSRVLKPAR
jgi:hypothetical protein